MNVSFWYSLLEVSTNISVPIAGPPPVLKPIKLKAKFALSLPKSRLRRVIPAGNPWQFHSVFPACDQGGIYLGGRVYLKFVSTILGLVGLRNDLVGREGLPGP